MEPVNPKREGEAALYHERQGRRRKTDETVKEGETWFQLVENNKVVKKTRTKAGNVYSVYVGTKKQCDAQGLKYVK